jgi:hypothetical protein
MRQAKKPYRIAVEAVRANLIFASPSQSAAARLPRLQVQRSQ